MYCIQYASKFGKVNSGHRPGKGQFSFQSQRKAMPKNAQTTAQLHSSHMLVKYYSKFSKPGFSHTWTVNFQMFKLVLEKAEEPEIKLPTSTGSSKKQESSRKASISALLLCQSLWLCESPVSIHVYPFHLEALSYLPSHPSRSSQSSRLTFLCYTAASH